MKVVVIGAGLGGLALAQGLRRRGIDVRVYEKDRALDERTQGYRIGLSPEGRDALRVCLPDELHALVEATSGDLTGPGRLFDDQLTLLGGEEVGPPDGGRVVDRHVFRHVLATGLEGHIGFGAALERFERSPDGRVRVVLRDGTVDVADVLVGADGAHSAVRRRLLPEIRLVPADLTGALGRTTLTERFRPLVPGRGTMIKGPGITLMLGRMEFRTPPTAVSPALPAIESYIRWVLLVPPDHPAVGPAAGHLDAREVVLDLIEGWHPEIRALVEHGSARHSGIGRAQLLDRPVPAWDVDGVTLLGDAAHLTVASGGNGANTALRDAAGLVTRLERDTDVVASLRAYQAEMLEYGNAAVEYAVGRQRDFVPEPAETTAGA